MKKGGGIVCERQGMPLEKQRLKEHSEPFTAKFFPFLGFVTERIAGPDQTL